MHSSPWRRLLMIVALVLVGTPQLAWAALVDAIEYYNAPLDHYFVTADPGEIAKLDSGFFVGWQRTGLSFKVSDPGSSLPGGSPVCRFYGNPKSGLDSHFYSASPAECAAVAQKFPDAWLLESSNVFQVFLPDVATGACPAGSVPIYRAWNNRTDSNHRYTTSLAVLQSMVAKGYVAEGYGPSAAPVVMCSPTGAAPPPPAPVPQCTLSANDTSPFIGVTISITASCSGSPTSYVWSGCSSSSTSCLASSSTPGLVTYSMYATNANGSSAPATIDIIWRNPLPPPTCTLTATSQSDPPVVGSLLQLNANCTNNPSSYTWSGCASNSNVCYVSESSSGPHTYTVTANNQSGPGTPASMTIVWSLAPQPKDFCGNFPSVLRTSMPWTNTRAVTASYPDPGFQWNGVWVVSFTVPANASSGSIGRFTVAEFGGPPVIRDVTVSRFACDFRPTDPAGNNGPVTEFGGISANTSFAVGNNAFGVPTLQAGQTYYVNVRNRAADGSSSCPSSPGRCDALLDLTVPR